MTPATGPHDTRYRVVHSVLLAVYVLATAAALVLLPYDLSGAFVVTPCLVAVSVPLLRRARGREGDPRIHTLFCWALAATLVAGVVHFYTVSDAYGGLADASAYHREGAEFAAKVWAGESVFDRDRFPVGTEFVYLLTGVIYTVIGPSVLGGHLFYSWLAFWGLYFCYLAFRTGLPDADHRRYAILLFFLPSTLFWSCAISKESWMMLGIGLTLLGGARTLTGTRGILPPLIGGVAIVTLVRPHVAILLLLAFTVAVLARRHTGTRPTAPLVKGFALCLLVAVGVLIGGRLATFLGVEDLNAESISNELDQSHANTSDAGHSTFTTSPVGGLLDLPVSTVNVLFRPFPWEAAGVLALLCSVESLVLAGVLVSSARRWSRVPSLLTRQPYVTLVVTTIPLFVVVLSTFANFGLLARERIMLLPLVLVPLCLAKATEGTAPERGTSAIPETGPPERG